MLAVVEAGPSVAGQRGRRPVEAQYVDHLISLLRRPGVRAGVRPDYVNRRQTTVECDLPFPLKL